MYQKINAVLFVLLIVFTAGCGNGNKRLTGKITYPDGSPVTLGFVYFDSKTASFQSRGEIMSDGTYEVGSVNAKDGIPPGEYAVFVISERRGGFAAWRPARRIECRTTGTSATSIRGKGGGVHVSRQNSIIRCEYQ